jgi:hypothetical protein
MREAVELGMLSEAGVDRVTDALARGDHSERLALAWWTEYTKMRRRHGTTRFSCAGSDYWPTVDVRQFGLVYVPHSERFGYYVDEVWLDPNPTAAQKEAYRDEAEGLEFSVVVQFGSSRAGTGPRETIASYDLLKPPFEGETLVRAG